MHRIEIEELDASFRNSPRCERAVESLERPEEAERAAAVAPAVVGQRRPQLVAVYSELRGVRGAGKHSGGSIGSGGGGNCSDDTFSNSTDMGLSPGPPSVRKPHPPPKSYRPSSRVKYDGGTCSTRQAAVLSWKRVDGVGGA